MKKKLLSLNCLIVMIVLLPVQVTDAKAKPKISVTSKSIYVGQSYTLKLKNVSAKAKVTWTTSKKSVVVVVKKKGNRVVIKGKNQGKANVTAKYKGKKYRCKIIVKNKEQTKEENTDSSEKTEKEELTIYRQVIRI